MSVAPDLLVLQSDMPATPIATAMDRTTDIGWVCVRADGDAPAGQVGIAFLGAFYGGHRHILRTRLRLRRAAVLRIEVHGLASRMNKIVAHIARDGTVLHQGEEVETLTALRQESGIVVVELTFRPYTSLIEWIYLFGQQIEAGSDPLFFCSETSLEPLPADRPHLPRRHMGLGHAQGVDVICQSFTVLRNSFSLVFELSRPASRLAGLGLTSERELAHCRWWTWEHAGLAPAEDELVACKPTHPIRSPALMDAYGPPSANLGHAIVGVFADWHELDRMSAAEADRLARLTLRARFQDGLVVDLPLSSMLQPLTPDTSRALIEDHLAKVASESPSPPTFLEVGARGAASAAVRRSVQARWRYIGLDYQPDPNVDIVGDAHRLTEFVARGSVDVVYSSEVMEHLLSPLRFVLEANRVLRMGGLFIARIPTTWPLHAEPWDFWRLSSHGWASLLNANSGFELLDSCELGMASVVPHLAPEGSGLLNMASAPAPMLTLAIARKVKDVSADTTGWSPDLASGSYDHA